MAKPLDPARRTEDHNRLAGADGERVDGVEGRPGGQRHGRGSACDSPRGLGAARAAWDGLELAVGDAVCARKDVIGNRNGTDAEFQAVPELGGAQAPRAVAR